MKKLIVILLMGLAAWTECHGAQGRIWAAKTNLLSDAAAIPNIGAEILFAERWSVSCDWHYAWWKNDRRHFYRQTYGGSLSVRKWLSRQKCERAMAGHHIGMYGQIFSYDFGRGGSGEMGAKPGGTLWDRCNWGLGIEYGYSLPLSSGLNLDFSLGVGRIAGKYIDYTAMDDHYVWQGTSMRKWFGPGKAEISLVWVLGNGR